MSNIFDKISSGSQDKIDELKKELSDVYTGETFINNICIYACGSMGRLEMTENSDLDLFFVSGVSEVERKEITNLEKYTFFAKLYGVNRKLKYQEPSKNGMYWEFTPKMNLLDIGSRQEDYNNSFTARMLLLLESKPLLNESAYDEIVEETIGKYFLDYKDYQDEFYPLYLMNDILRYWYTLTLNYEYRRDEKDDANKKYWKRLKLKYARLITCYSMLACLFRKKITPEYVMECVKKTPFERLRVLGEESEEVNLLVKEIEQEYEWYLALRKEEPTWWNESNNKKVAMLKADNFHDLVVHRFMKCIADANPELRKKTDLY